MKKLIFAVMAVFAMAAGVFAAETPSDPSQIKMFFYANPSSKATFLDGKLSFAVAGKPWDVAMVHDITLVKGGKYNVQFACNSAGQNVEVKLQKKTAPYTDIDTKLVPCFGNVNVDLVSNVNESEGQFRVNYGANPGIYTVGQTTFKMTEVVAVTEPKQKDVLDMAFWSDPSLVKGMVTGNRNEFAVAAPLQPWQANVSHAPFAVEAGKKVDLAFACNSIPATKVEVRVQKASGDYATYATAVVDCNGQVNIPLTASATDPAAVIIIAAGANPAKYSIGGVKIN